jgi:flavodoxin
MGCGAQPMKVSVIYYTETGQTQKVARAFADTLARASIARVHA